MAKFLEEKFDESETCLNKAKSVLEVRISNLSKMETSENLAKEIEDLHTLVKEIDEKINDHKVAEKAKVEGKGEGMSAGFTGMFRMNIVNQQKSFAWFYVNADFRWE